jgi:hypothetical protein
LEKVVFSLRGLPILFQRSKMAKVELSGASTKSMQLSVTWRCPIDGGADVCDVYPRPNNAQKVIAKEVREQGADYVLALKDDHSHLRSSGQLLVDQRFGNSSNNSSPITRLILPKEAHARIPRTIIPV